jgi:hypothetical protein
MSHKVAKISGIHLRRITGLGRTVRYVESVSCSSFSSCFSHLSPFSLSPFPPFSLVGWLIVTVVRKLVLPLPYLLLYLSIARVAVSLLAPRDQDPSFYATNQQQKEKGFASIGTLAATERSIFTHQLVPHSNVLDS